MDVLSILVGVAILVQLVMLCFLISIATSLSIERRDRADRDALIRRAWFKERGYKFASAGDCVCSEDGPCMTHYRLYYRWRSGATEADDIGYDIAARLKE